MTAPDKPVVWITRPQPGADKSAAAIATLRCEPVVLPLTEIAAIDPEIDTDDAAGADFVVVTSGNAVRLTPQPLVDAIKDKPAYTVGDATKADALARGFVSVRSAGGDVDDLAALVAERERPGTACVYLAGRRRTGNLEGKLRAQGHECLVAEVYSTKSVSQVTELLSDALNRRRPDAILFHSSLSARVFADHMATASSQAYEKTLFLAISQRVADTLPEAVKLRAIVAEAPTEQALLSALLTSLATTRN